MGRSRGTAVGKENHRRGRSALKRYEKALKMRDLWSEKKKRQRGRKRRKDVARLYLV